VTIQKRLFLNYSDRRPDISSSTLKKLQDWFRGQKEVDCSFIEGLKDDSRRGSTELAEMCHRKNERYRRKKERTASLKELEFTLHGEGYEYIAEVDEAGRGALAGPVTASAVILPEEMELPGVDDSKKLSQKKRKKLC